MKKPTMIIGKKQIILAGMTLILGLAVYINYAVSTSDGKIKANKKLIYPTIESYKRKSDKPIDYIYEV